MSDQYSNNVSLKYHLTLSLVAGLVVCLRTRQLHRMRNNIPSRSCPVDSRRAISRGPFGTDISVDLDSMRSAIGSCGRKCHIGEWKGLFDEVGRLSKVTCKSRSDEISKSNRGVIILTSTGLRNVAVKSTGPADMTKVLCVDVHCVPASVPYITGVCVKTHC